jgi:hypothetical protein
MSWLAAAQRGLLTCAQCSWWLGGTSCASLEASTDVAAAATNVHARQLVCCQAATGCSIVTVLRRVSEADAGSPGHPLCAEHAQHEHVPTPLLPPQQLEPAVPCAWVQAAVGAR